MEQVARIREERELIAAAIRAYLRVTEALPQIYRFAMSQLDIPGSHDLITASTRTVAAGLSRVIGGRYAAPDRTDHEEDRRPWLPRPMWRSSGPASAASPPPSGSSNAATRIS